MSIKVIEIEEQLREIWKGFSKQHDHVVTRAQVMNLLVYAPRIESEEEVSQVLSDIAQESPGRMIVLLGGSEESMSGWVNALCHLSSAGRKQVCCEQIMIRGGIETPLQWSSAVLPLLVPDLPVFLWWHESISRDAVLLNVLTESVDRLIIDSSSTEGAGILPLMDEKGEWLSVSDLNWSNLTPWRAAIAGLYDHPEFRACLEGLTKIEIDCETQFRQCWRAQLLIGWIASSMNWKWAERPNLINSKEDVVVVDIRTTLSREDKIQRVRLVSDRSEFLISFLSECSYLRCEILIEGKNLDTQVIQFPARSLSALMSKELSILGHDRIYEKVIRFLD